MSWGLGLGSLLKTPECGKEAQGLHKDTGREGLAGPTGRKGLEGPLSEPWIGKKFPGLKRKDSAWDPNLPTSMDHSYCEWPLRNRVLSHKSMRAW